MRLFNGDWWMSRGEFAYPTMALSENVELTRVPNPPTTARTSAPTAPITVVEAMRFDDFTPTNVMADPAFARGIQLVTGSIATLAWKSYDKDGDVVDQPVLEQPEKLSGLPASVTYSRLAFDVYVHGRCLWKVDEKPDRRYATSYRRVPINRWYQDPDTGKVMVDGVKQDAEQIRLFVGPYEGGLLARIGPTLYLMDRLRDLVLRYINNPQAREVMKGLQGLGLTDEKIEQLLTDYEAKRKRRVTAYLPEELDIKEMKQMTPEEMLLIQAQVFMTEQAGHLMSIDGFWLGVGKQGMTYSNRIDLRDDLKTQVLHPMVVKPIEERLSFGDVVPSTQKVRANWDSFLRLNTLDRMQAYKVGKEVGAYTTPEIRELENRKPLSKEELDRIDSGFKPTQSQGEADGNV